MGLGEARGKVDGFSQLLLGLVKATGFEKHRAEQRHHVHVLGVPRDSLPTELLGLVGFAGIDQPNDVVQCGF